MSIRGVEELVTIYCIIISAIKIFISVDGSIFGDLEGITI